MEFFRSKNYRIFQWWESSMVGEGITVRDVWRKGEHGVASQGLLFQSTVHLKIHALTCFFTGHLSTL